MNNKQMIDNFYSADILSKTAGVLYAHVNGGFIKIDEAIVKYQAFTDAYYLITEQKQAKENMIQGFINLFSEDEKIKAHAIKMFGL